MTSPGCEFLIREVENNTAEFPNVCEYDLEGCETACNSTLSLSFSAEILEIPLSRLFPDIPEEDANETTLDHPLALLAGETQPIGTICNCCQKGTCCEGGALPYPDEVCRNVESGTCEEGEYGQGNNCQTELTLDADEGRRCAGVCQDPFRFQLNEQPTWINFGEEEVLESQCKFNLKIQFEGLEDDLIAWRDGTGEKTMRDLESEYPQALLEMQKYVDASLNFWETFDDTCNLLDDSEPPSTSPGRVPDSAAGETASDEPRVPDSAAGEAASDEPSTSPGRVPDSAAPDEPSTSPAPAGESSTIAAWIIVLTVIGGILLLLGAIWLYLRGR